MLLALCCGPDSPHPSTFLIGVFRFWVSCSIFFIVFAFFLCFSYLRFFLLFPGNSSFFSVFVFFFVFLCFLFSTFSFCFGSLSVLTPLRFFLSSRGRLRFFRFLSSDPLSLFRFVFHYTVITEVSPGALGRLVRGERMAAPPARPQEHFSITLRSRSLAQSGCFFFSWRGILSR